MMATDTTVPDEMMPYPASRFTGKSRQTLLMAHALGKVRGRVVGGRLFLLTRDLEQLREQESPVGRTPANDDTG